MSSEQTEPTRYQSLISLFLVNMIPVFGVLFFGWSLFSVMFLYWLENGIIGFYTALKMARVGGISSLLLVPFFCLHYGGFMAGHLVFLLVFFANDPVSKHIFNNNVLSLAFSEVAIPSVALFISHGHSFFSNFLGKKEFASSSIDRLMAAPYKRIAIMHLTILFGAFLIEALHEPMAGLLLLICLKTFSDAGEHIKERKRSYFAKT
jgi:hypothetical protein